MADVIEPLELMKRGRDLALGGRLAEAETLFLEALGMARGRGDALESSACGNLGSLYGVMGRPYEAILLYRRGLSISRSGDDPPLVARHLANIASMFVELDLWDEAAHALAESETAVGALPPKQQAEASDLTLWARAHRAVHRGQDGHARVLLERFRVSTQDRDDAPARTARLALEAGVLRMEGRAAQALALLEEAERAEEAPGLDGLFLRFLRMRALQDLGRRQEACDEALRLLDVLEADVAGHGIGELSIDLAVDVGHALAEYADRRALAHRAYDLAASIVLARIAALDACARAVPELSTLPDEDRAWIANLRSVYQKQQRALLRHVAALLKDASNGDASILHAGGVDGSIVRICAWCSRVGTREGHWLPLAHYIPNDAELLVTHCICTDCQTGGGLHA